ncbi:NUDIX hydrolase [Kribbella sp. NPDC056861]|uniref:NUDIX hydrolase n=1 Tax=Kribbella sp. NPDC056861 TaxID=3154857 RepID=UPI00343763A8
MTDFAGVLAFRAGRVALVREHYEDWTNEQWSLPSGKIEPGESPSEAAARELREETGLLVTPDQLTLIAEVLVVSHDGTSRSTAWNYSADVPIGDFTIDDPDASVQEARWFSPADAIPRVAAIPYPPLSTPVAAYLSDPTPTRWDLHLRPSRSLPRPHLQNHQLTAVLIRWTEVPVDSAEVSISNS